MRTLAFIFLIVVFYSCETTRRTTHDRRVTYVPDDKGLYDTIVKHDSIFFGAYNTCNVNLAKYAAYYAEDVEFYHDKGGVQYSKKDIVESTRTNVCGRVTRTLIPGSIEVYPIANYGAVEIGYHTFGNNTEKSDSPPHPGRFVIIWKHTNNLWQITRVISLH